MADRIEELHDHELIEGGSGARFCEFDTCDLVSPFRGVVRGCLFKGCSTLRMDMGGVLMDTRIIHGDH